MSGPTNLRADLNQVVVKYLALLGENQNSEAFLKMLADINNLLQTVDVNSQQKQKSVQDKFKKYVVSTLKFANLSKMISGIAHEVNTPLAIIQIRTDQLVEATQNGEFDKEAFEKSLTSIDQTAKRIGTIVTRLRSYSKSLNNEEISRVSANKLIEDTTALTKDRFLADGILLEISCTEDFEIDCRPSDISQSLLNILNNSQTALKDMKDKWIGISINKKENKGVIEVADSGPGIPKDLRSHIFEPYFTFGTAEDSLGLGLTIARDYIEVHQGKLTIDESSEKTKFIFSLPLSLPLPDQINF